MCQSFIASLLLTIFLAPASRQQEEPLRVGTKEAPPFAIEGSDGLWSGLSIDLWRELARRLDLEFELVDRDLAGLLEGLSDGSLDASVAALTITAEREEDIDFTHPFFISGLGIAVPAASGGVAGFLAAFPWLEFLGVLAGLAAVLMGAAVLVWLFERHRNPEQFGGGRRGLAEGFWWSAVTMTTVGYGDRSPQTFGGRVVAVIWMFASIFMISAFTATVASVMTASHFSSVVTDVDDLGRARVATVADSTSTTFLSQRGVGFRTHATAEEALRALVAGQADAVVYDAPLLRYLIRTRHPGEAEILPIRVREQQYGIGLPPESPRREAINRELLEILREPSWQDTVRSYLGE